MKIIDNNISTSIIVIIVFFIALEQSFSISIEHRFFKIRLGVLLSNAILCALSIVLNVELMDVVDDNFVLIVRTLQILWLFVAFFIGYFFVTNSIKSAYSSSIYNENSHKKVDIDAPKWINKFWFLCTIFMEMALFLCCIIAFSTRDILYINVLWTITFLMAVIGAILVLFSLIDIRIKSKRIASSKIDSLRNSKLNQMNRLIVIMIILCLMVIIACGINLIILINHLTKSKLITDSLYSTVIDNTLDYITYMVCLLFIEILLVFWTYKSSSINYCLYPIYGYKKDIIVSNASFFIDKNTLCYVFCKHIIEGADNKRIILHLKQKAENKMLTTNTRPTKSSFFSSANDSNKYHMQSNMENSNENTLEIETENKEIEKPKNKMKIKIILYDFDGVLTTQCKYRYFEHWNDNDITSLTRKHMNTIFGNDKRINVLKNNFKKWNQNGYTKQKIITFETTNKILKILNKIGLNVYFNDIQNDIIGCDNQEKEKFSIKYFILKLINMQNIGYDEILYISADHENVTHFNNINLCQCYHIKLNGGLNQNDINIIHKYYY